MKNKLNPIWWLYRIVEKNKIPKAFLSNFEREALIKFIFKLIEITKEDVCQINIQQIVFRF